MENNTPFGVKRKHAGEHDAEDNDTAEKRNRLAEKFSAESMDLECKSAKGTKEGSGDHSGSIADGTKLEEESPSSSESLGRAAAEGIALVNALKNAGADHDLQLPRIVFAGKQSAGKSSLVEAVTGIALPRAHGTCTKCPIEVTTERVQHDSPNFWECEVSLRIMFGENGESPENIKVCKITAEQRSEMPDKIEEAQEQILEKSGDGKQKFTKNTICVHIRGRECQNLSIVDLPGLIQSVDKAEDERYIHLVEGLVKEYLQSDKTVILQCFQSDEDIENQKIRTLAREADPDGKRCLGVLTKPDKIERGTEDTVIGMLRGDIYELQWGYFIVRCPNQDELKKLKGMDNLTKAGKRRCNIENDFFSSDDLGRKLRDAKPECCGSNKLLAKLASMLQEMISAQIPSMRDKLEKRLRETNKHLDDLGVSVSQKESNEALSKIIQTYCNAVQNHVNTGKREKGFWQDSMTIFSKTGRLLRKAGPTFEVGGKAVFEAIIDVQETSEDDWSLAHTIDIPFSRWQQKQKENTTTEFEAEDITWQASLDFDNNEIPSVGLEIIRLDNKIRSVHCQFKVCTAGSENSSSCQMCDETLKKGGRAQFAPVPIADIKDDDLRIRIFIRIKSYAVDPKSKHVYTVGDVKNMIEEAKGRELAIPGPAGYESCMMIIGNTIKHWREPALNCVDRVHKLMKKWFVKDKDHVLDVSVPKRYRLLRDEMTRIVMRMLETYKTECSDAVTRLWEMESNEFTLNEHYMATNRRQYRAIVDRIVSSNDLDTKLKSLTSENKQELGSLLGSLGLSTDKLKLIPTSSTFDDEAIDSIAGSLAYVRVALKRFQDYVPLHIQYHMIDKFSKDCEDVLKREFGVFHKTPEEIHHFFQEDTSTEQRRKDLLRRKVRQERALELILNHENKERTF